MICFADTSFLCHLYGFNTDFHAAANDWWDSNAEADVYIGEYVRVELFALWHTASLDGDAAKRATALKAKIAFDSAIERGVLSVLPPPEGADLFAHAHMLISDIQTFGCKGSDVCHVAEASLIRSAGFLSCDDAQRKLAFAAGMDVFPRISKLWPDRPGSPQVARF